MKKAKVLLALLITVAMLICPVPISVSAAIPAIPEMENEHNAVDFYQGMINSVTVPAGKNMYYDGYRMAGWLPYYFQNLSAAEYIEMDVYVSSATESGVFCFWVTNSWDSATTRGRVTLPALKEGWNHVVFEAAAIGGNGGFNFYTYNEWNSIFFEGTPSSTTDVTVAFGNIALTKSISSINNQHSSTVWIQEGLFWTWDQPASTACNWSDYSYISTNNSVIDASKAQYFEFDVMSSVDLTGTGTYVWLSVNTGDLTGRAKYMLPDIKEGLNHIVINLAENVSVSNSGNNIWDLSKLLCMRIKVNSNLPSVDYTLKFYNASFTCEQPVMNKTYNATIYEQEGLFWDWNLSAGSTTKWSDYTAVDKNGSIIDITGAEYFEFDVVSNADFPGCNMWMSVSSGDSGGRVRYAFPSLKKGSNHVVIDLSKIEATSNHGGLTWSTDQFAYIRMSLSTAQLISYNLKFYNAAFTWDPIIMESEKIEEYEAINVTVKGDASNIINIYADGVDVAIYSFSVGYYGEGKTFNLLDLGPFAINDYVIETVSKSDNTVIDSHKFSVVTRRKLQLPLSATYELKNDTDGLAEGTLTVVIDEELNSATDIIPYWADENGILEGYKSLYAFRVTGETTVFEVEPWIIIPKGATKLRLYAQDYDEGTTTEDYLEIDLPEGAAATEEWGDLITEFQVVSDTHVSESGSYNSSYTRMLNDIVKISPNSSGLFINGDVTDNGTVAQYEKHQELHASVSGAPDYYIAVGNHEFYDTTQAETETRFASFARLPDRTAPDSQHYDFWLNGYHYIILGNDAITSDKLSSTFTDETMAWLRTKLEEDRNDNRPTFVFHHQPIQGTVAGSLGDFTNGAFTGLWGANATKIKNVLKDFPEVVLFSSHQHILLGYPQTMHERTDSLPTIFNTASASKGATIRDGIKEKGNASEGYYLYVYEDKIIVRGRDFATGEWIPSAQFYVDFEGGSGAATVDVQYDLTSIGEETVTKAVAKGSKLEKPDFESEDYILDGLFEDAKLTTEFDFSSFITEKTTIYAKWLMKGDLSQDDSLDMLDLVKMKNSLLETETVYNKVADLVADGLIDVLDFGALKKKLFAKF